MARSLKGDLSTLRGVRSALRKMPTTVSHSVASRGAPALTGKAQASYTQGQTVYDDPRPRGVDGQPLTLERTGDAQRAIRFVASGTVMRVPLGPDYVKYLVGKYEVLPIGDRSPVPRKWKESLSEITSSECDTFVRQLGGTPK